MPATRAEVVVRWVEPDERREPDAIRLEIVVRRLAREQVLRKARGLRRASQRARTVARARARGPNRARWRPLTLTALAAPSRETPADAPPLSPAPFPARPSGSISAALVARGIRGWPHFQR